MTTDSDLLSERMADLPYAPIPNVNSDRQNTHAMQYIAFSLGQIEKHLKNIADSLTNNSHSNELIRLQLLNIEKAIKESVPD